MQEYIFWYILIGLLGLAIGSFLNVLIYRLPRKKAIVMERSACPNCRMAIPFYHNIPIISYLILLGRCSVCRHPISPRYPMVEILNAGFYLLFYHLDGLTLQLGAHCFLTSALIAIFFIDLDFQIIPDKITLPGIVVGFVSSIFVSPPGILNSVIGFLVGGLSLLAIAYLGEWLFKKEAMGGGDIKMAAMMGAFVGWQKILLIFFGGALIGMVVSIVWMGLSKRVRKERMIPFGPFLAMAAIVVVLFGEQIINYYIEHILLS
ncbi:MAG: prepilin peptidase [candidate division Zixibacteria bacterium]|nr:prepilin peptidase [candidate division Zixibacteria bacterium]